ncbi:hypothetical protein [Salinimonas chungwhensis]|uniref:hypothetical protein n=1 Tax=Salinimonas chungwhensis TaxID=265425 RepID=UPI00036A5B11|nr:hypothetical protein [Salinimonas chungwhensis]
MACLSLMFCSLLAMPGDIITEPAVLPETPVITTPDNLPDTWMDLWQRNLTQSMNYTVQQLDSFFALKGSNRHEDARAEGRISLGWEPRSRDLAEFDVRFKIRVQLPALENRVDLMLSDDEDSQQNASIKAARQPIERRRRNTTIALRYRSSDNARMSYKIGTGRRGQIYTKARYADMAAYSDQLALFYDAEAYAFTRDQFGAELGATVQFISQSEHVFRFNNRFFYRDRFEDWVWRHEAQYLQPVDNKTAVIYTLFTEGESRPNYRLGEVYTSARWRSNPTRDWLFFEVEPFVLFTRDEGFKPSYGVALRVEAYYGNP